MSKLALEEIKAGDILNIKGIYFSEYRFVVLDVETTRDFTLENKSNNEVTHRICPLYEVIEAIETCKFLDLSEYSQLGYWTNLRQEKYVAMEKAKDIKPFNIEKVTRYKLEQIKR